MAHRMCRKGCGKRSLPGLGAAINAALRASVKSGQPLRPYRCPRGDGWHLTRKKEWRQAAA